MTIRTLVTVSVLLTLPASLPAAEPGGEQAPDIFTLVKAGRTEAVRSIITQDQALVGAVDELGYTPLNWAATRAHWDILVLLLEAGAAVDHVGGDGGTVLHRACHHDRPDMVRLLVEKGADISIRNRWGRTPLHVAIRRGCLRTASLMLELGSDTDAVTNEGWTPLHVAWMSGQPECVELLLKGGAAAETPDREGRLPADHAFTRPEPIELDQSRIPEYTGEYDLGDGFSMTVWPEGGSLHFMEFAPDEIYPIGEDLFYCRREPWQVSFNRNEAGEVAEIEVRFLRRTVTGVRITGGDASLTYVGSERCGSCHADPQHGGEYITWLSSRHALAYWRLATDWAGFLAAQREEYRDLTDPISDVRCLRCHTTGGHDRDARFESGYRKEEGVGCEACHGPGAAYQEEGIMLDRRRFLANGGRIPTVETCRQCHRDDQFRFETWWEKIAHDR